MRRPRGTILVVDDDLGTRETFGISLQLEGFVVDLAGSGTDALSIARSKRFDLLVLDLDLGDMMGIDVVRALRTDCALTPFILISAYLTTDTTVKAMRLGAVDVLDKPVAVEQLHRAVCTVLARPDRITNEGEEAPIVPLRGDAPSQSVAERWAGYVLKACESTHDLRTVADWAAWVGVSASTMREQCYLLGILPKDARDLVRVLRAVVQAARHNCLAETIFDVSDRRTLKGIFERAGLQLGVRTTLNCLDGVLASQRFVPAGNDGLNTLRALLRAKIGRLPEPVALM